MILCLLGSQVYKRIKVLNPNLWYALAGTTAYGNKPIWLAVQKQASYNLQQNC